MGERAICERASRVVIKVGTAVVTRPEGGIALAQVGELIEQIARLRRRGVQVILVSSGSVSLGMQRLGLKRRPVSVVDRQACAAAGQGALQALYDTFCAQLGFGCAQVLLTEEDFLDRERYLNLSATLERLLELGALPIINENDTVSTRELALDARMVFGDNDRLSALVAAGLDADLLVLLSDVDALYTDHPSVPGATRISVFSDSVDVCTSAEGRRGGRGGMGAKVAATRIANLAGTTVVIGSGVERGTLERVLAGDDVGTLFPAAKRGTKRQRWLAFATRPSGQLVVNVGATRALVERKASLLFAGLVEVKGEFVSGAVVSVCDETGAELGRGFCARSSSQIRAGEVGGRPLIHRDKIVIFLERGVV